MPNFGECAGMLRNFADPSLNFTKIIFQSKGKHSQSAEYANEKCFRRNLLSVDLPDFPGLRLAEISPEFVFRRQFLKVLSMERCRRMNIL